MTDTFRFVPIGRLHHHYGYGTRVKASCEECFAVFIGNDPPMLVEMLKEHRAAKHPPRDFQDDDAYRAHWEPQ